jgi:hypothetical protein
MEEKESCKQPEIGDTITNQPRCTKVNSEKAKKPLNSLLVCIA